MLARWHTGFALLNTINVCKSVLRGSTKLHSRPPPCSSPAHCPSSSLAWPWTRTRPRGCPWAVGKKTFLPMLVHLLLESPPQCVVRIGGWLVDRHHLKGITTNIPNAVSLPRVQWGRRMSDGRFRLGAGKECSVLSHFIISSQLEINSNLLYR